jgi:hypothetical protein
MSVCSKCNLTIEEGAKLTESPCCELKYHSSCAIQKMIDQYCQHTYIVCECGVTLYHSPYWPQNNSDVSSSETVETIRTKEGVAEELKAIKRLHTEEHKAATPFKRKLASIHTEFKDDISEMLNNIKQIKANALNSIKESEEFKNLRKVKQRRIMLENRFQRKHNLRLRHMRLLLNCQHWGNRWRQLCSSPAYLMRRKFRIKV